MSLEGFYQIILERTRMDNVNNQNKSYQCKGKNKCGTRCKIRTKNISRRCHIHDIQDVTLSSSGRMLNEDDAECCVCMDEMSRSDYLDCGHGVCIPCLEQFRDDRCPLCRRFIHAKHISLEQRETWEKRRQEDIAEIRLLEDSECF
jgi:hypothetical protein